MEPIEEPTPMILPRQLSSAALSRLGLSLLLSCGAATAPVAGADGDLDLTFHAADGGVFAGGTPGDAQAVKGIPAPDGATVVLYHYTELDGTPRQDRWRRVTDSAAGADCDLTAPSVTGIVARSAIFDRQGRLVVVGTDYDDTRQAVVERFLYPDCIRDPAFDGNGIAGYLAGELAIGVDLAALRVGEAPFSVDYYYLVATVQDPVIQVVLMRLHLDGSPDTGWGGGDGRVEAGLPGARAYAQAMEADAHGRLVVAVMAEDISPHDFDFGVFRFLASGSLDSSFDGNGKKTIPFNVTAAGEDVPYAIALASDDRIAVVGTVAGTDWDELGVAVLRENGDYDAAFDGDGRLHLPIGFGASGEAARFQSDGKLLAAGSRVPPALGLVRTPAYPAPYVARFGPGGGLDPDFGDGGVALPGGAIFSQHFAGATTLALDAGRAMVGGYVQREGEEVDNFFLLRLEDRLIFADGFESRNTTWW